MAGIRGNYTDSLPNFDAEEYVRDTNTLLANDGAILSMLLGGNSALVSGGALTSGSGMVVNVAQAVVVSANGILCTMPAGTVTPAAGGSQPRIDVVYALVTQNAAGTPDTVTSRATFTDTAAVGLLPGVPASSPATPTVASGFYVQIGSVYVPANATTSAGCTLNSGTTAPNSQGAIGAAILNAVIHAATSLANAVVHGFQATGPGAAQPDRLAVTDTVYGRVGRAYVADNVYDDAGNLRAIGDAAGAASQPYKAAIYDGNGEVYNSARLQGYVPGGGAGNIPVLDGDSRVADSEAVRGYVPGSGFNNLAVLDGNGAVAKAEGLVAAGVVHKFTSGKTGTFSLTNQQDTAWTVTLDDNSFTPTVVVASVIGISSPTNFQDFVVVRSWGAGTASGVVYQVGGGPDSVQVHVFAYA